MEKKIKLNFVKTVVIGFLMLVVVLFTAFPFLGINLSIYLDTLLQPNPPKPAIKYGEFPFKLEYELNGELIVIEDTLICEYDGIKMVGGQKERSWTSRLASGGEDRIELLVLSDTEEWYQAVVKSIGSPKDLMGEPREPHITSGDPEIVMYRAALDTKKKMGIYGPQNYLRKRSCSKNMV